MFRPVAPTIGRTMESVSLQDLIKDCAAQMNDLYEGVTTAASAGTNILTDNRLGNIGNIVQLDNQFAGSQVVFEEPAATTSGHTVPGPHTVIANSVGADSVTVFPALRASGVVASGLAYFMVRGAGRGRPYLAYRNAIRYALDELNVAQDALDSSLTTATDTYLYTIPTNLSAIYKVEFVKSGYTTLQILPRDWKMKPGRKLWLTNANLNVSFGWTLYLYGELDSPLPATLDATIYCPRSAVVDLAVEQLQRNQSNQAANQRAAQRQQERLRFNRMAPRPNLRRVIP